MERKDLLARVQAARASGHEVWVTTSIDGRFVVRNRPAQAIDGEIPQHSVFSPLDEL
jgi:hypothetical protein